MTRNTEGFVPIAGRTLRAIWNKKESGTPMTNIIIFNNAVVAVTTDTEHAKYLEATEGTETITASEVEAELLRREWTNDNAEGALGRNARPV